MKSYFCCLLGVIKNYKTKIWFCWIIILQNHVSPVLFFLTPLISSKNIILLNYYIMKSYFYCLISFTLFTKREIWFPIEGYIVDSNGKQQSKAESINGSSLASMGLESTLLNKTVGICQEHVELIITSNFRVTYPLMGLTVIQVLNCEILVDWTLRTHCLCNPCGKAWCKRDLKRVYLK